MLNITLCSISRVIRCLTAAILLTNPTWPTYKPQAELAGHSPYIVPTTAVQRWRVTPDALEKVSQITIYMYTHHFTLLAYSLAFI